jgi:hypothetical protein
MKVLEVNSILLTLDTLGAECMISEDECASLQGTDSRHLTKLICMRYGYFIVVTVGETSTSNTNCTLRCSTWFDNLKNKQAVQT